MYGKGISRVGEILDIAIANDIVSKAGAWFSFGDIRLGQGRENVKARLEEEKDLLNLIEDEVRKVLYPEKVKPEEDTEDKKGKKGKDEKADKEVNEEGALKFDEV